MEDLLALVGTVVITSKTLYWITGLGYIVLAGVSIYAAYIAPKTTDFGLMTLGCADTESSLRALCTWILVT